MEENACRCQTTISVNVRQVFLVKTVKKKTFAVLKTLAFAAHAPMIPQTPQDLNVLKLLSKLNRIYL